MDNRWILIAQHIMFHITQGTDSIPKYTLFACTVKLLTDTTEFIIILKKLGHCINYSKYQNIQKIYIFFDF